MSAINLSFRCSQDSTDSNSSEKSLGSEGDGSIVVNQDSKRNSTPKENLCNLCEYRTNRRSNLIRHLMTMHQTHVDNSMECCGNKFANKAALKEHKRDVHGNGYTCRVCQRDFCRLALLKRHMNVHSGKKENVCHICDYATSHKSNLDRHIARLHPNRDAVEKSIRKMNPMSQRLAANPRKRTRFVVSEADQSLSSFSSFDDETAEFSEDSNGCVSKPRLGHVSYACMTCSLSFGSQLDLVTHSRICYINRYKEAEKPQDESVLLAAIALTQMKYPSYIVDNDDRRFLETI